jgi:hypothetical protein
MSANIFNDLWKIFGLLVGTLIFLRIMYIFIYPLFCYSSSRISNSEENNNLQSTTNTLQLINSKTIPIVDAKYCINDEKFNNNIPIAIIIQ